MSVYVLTTVVSSLQVFTPLMQFTASAVFSYMHCSCVSRTNTDDTEVCASTVLVFHNYIPCVLEMGRCIAIYYVSMCVLIL